MTHPPPHRPRRRPRRPGALAALPLLLALLGVAPPPGRAAPPEGAPGWEAYAGSLPGAEEGRGVYLVRDARTGRPVAGAQVEARAEYDWDAQGWAPLHGRWRTDADGLVELPVPADEGDCHWEVRAPGYRVEHEYGPGPYQESTFDLWPAEPLHGRVVDGAGRPVAGATAAWKKGCAHAPFHGLARSDPRGRFVFPDGDAESDVGVIAGPGLAFDAYNGDVAPVWARPPLAVVAPGRRLAGRVLAQPGRWGLTLAIDQCSRPLLVPVRPDGTFEVEGVADDARLELWGWEPAPEPWPPHLAGQERPTPWLALKDWTPGRFLVWDPRVDPDAEDSRAFYAALTLPGLTGEPEEGPELTFDRDDGRRFVARPQRTEQGAPRFEVRVPPGVYQVTCQGPFSRYAGGPVRFVQPESGQAPPFALPLRERARLVLPEGLAPLERALGAEEVADLVLRVAAAGADQGVEVQRLRPVSEPGSEDACWVPPDGPVVVWRESAFGALRGEAGPVERGVRPVRLVHTPPAVIWLPDLWAPEEEPDVLVEFAPSRVERREGRVRVRVPGPGGYALHLRVGEQSASLPVRIPPDAGALTLDRGTLALEPRPEQSLRLRWDDAPPAAEEDDPIALDVRVLRLDGPEPGSRWVREDGFALERLARDLWTGRHRDLVPGAWVALDLQPLGEAPGDAAPEAEGRDGAIQWAPLFAPVSACGPTEVRVPAGGLDLAVETDAARYTVYVDGALFEERRDDEGRLPRLRVRGLAAGEHVLIVAAPGGASRRLRLSLAPGEVRALRAVLPPRAP